MITDFPGPIVHESVGASGDSLQQFLYTLGATSPETVGLTGDRFEYLAIAATLILAVVTAIAVWLFSGGSE